MTSDLGELLVSSGDLSEESLREALAYRRAGDLSLPEALLKLNLADEPTVYRALAKQNGMPFVDLDKGRVSEAILEKVPAEVATEQGVLPLMEKNGKLVVAIATFMWTQICR